MTQVWHPKVGDGCNYGQGCDTYPYTVRRVSQSGKTVWVSPDRYRVKPGHGGLVEGRRECFFFPQDLPDTEWKCFKLKKDGRFRAAGKNYRGKPSLRAGRAYANDPHK